METEVAAIALSSMRSTRGRWIAYVGAGAGALLLIALLVWWFAATILIHRYDVAPDGRILVMEHVPDPPGLPFAVLLNWRSLAAQP